MFIMKIDRTLATILDDLVAQSLAAISAKSYAYTYGIVSIDASVRARATSIIRKSNMVLEDVRHVYETTLGT